MGKHALSPEVFRDIVRRAHSDRLRVSVHVSAPEISRSQSKVVPTRSHIWRLRGHHARTCEAGREPRRGGSHHHGTGGGRAGSLPPPMREAAAAMRVGAITNLKTLVANGVTIVIGADTPADTTAAEAAYLQALECSTTRPCFACGVRRPQLRFSRTEDRCGGRVTKRAFWLSTLIRWPTGVRHGKFA